MSLGSELSAARVQAGLTLADVSERSRIRQTVIARIEADDFSLCGGDVYARGHIRTLAKLAGTDPEALVAEFDRLYAPHAPSATEIFEAETHRTRERRGPNWTAAMAAAVVVLLAVAGFQLLRGGSSPRGVAAQSADTTQASSASSTIGSSRTSPSTPSSAATTTSTRPTVIAQVPPSSTGVTMRLNIVGRSWVSVTAGGRKVYEGVLNDGASRTFTDPKQIKIIIGNAGAVHLVVNGVDLGTAGGNGQVVRLTFGPGNPTGQG